MTAVANKRKRLVEYFAELDRLPVLSREETCNLIVLAQGGDLRSRNRVVECNLRLVVKIVGRYVRHADLEDLVAEGNMGLFDAVRDFDISKGVTFGTYAGWKVYNRVMKMLAEPPYCGVVRMPKYVADAVKDVDHGKAAPATVHGKTLDMARRNLRPSKRLDLFPDGNEVPVFDKSPDVLDCIELDQLRRMLGGELAMGLPERERSVLRMMYGQGFTLRQCSAVLGISKERVRQIKNEALRRLRATMAVEIGEADDADDADE